MLYFVILKISVGNIANQLSKCIKTHSSRDRFLKHTIMQVKEWCKT